MVLVPTAVILYVLNADASAVEAELKRIRSAGEPTTGDELEEFYRTPDLDADCTGIYLNSPGSILVRKAYNQFFHFLVDPGATWIRSAL